MTAHGVPGVPGAELVVRGIVVPGLSAVSLRLEFIAEPALPGADLDPLAAEPAGGSRRRPWARPENSARTATPEKPADGFRLLAEAADRATADGGVTGMVHARTAGATVENIVAQFDLHAALWAGALCDPAVRLHELRKIVRRREWRGGRQRRRLRCGNDRWPGGTTMAKPLPIHIEYFTAFVDDDGRLQMRNDLYGYSALVRGALGLGG